SSGLCSSIIINGSPRDDGRIYRVATIDYLANGGDYMLPLTEGKLVVQSANKVYEDLLDHFMSSRKKRTINPPSTRRMHQ
ncbi:MAG: 5'-nucleotidase C-terminal domain-containing protein, partial [Muribaculaceae bacterium]|nr:5'-nucleotidase C-terminal domain-containing protein [Muribaculaceae bacterium]